MLWEFKNTLVLVLQLAPKTQEIKVYWSNYSDLKRRCSIIENSRGNCEFVVTRIDDELDKPFYINFEFFVRTIQSKQYEPTQIPLHPVDQSSYNTLPVCTRLTINTRIHYIVLRGFSGAIWIRVSKVIGTLHDHAVFSSG